MLTIYKNVEKTVVVLNDLLKINNDRIACYEQALNDNVYLDTDLKNIFKEIISEANEYKSELMDKVKSLAHDPKNKVTISGILHRAWMELKMTIIGNTRSSIIKFCMYNEEIALQTYQAALNVSDRINEDVTELIEQQQRSLRRTYELIRNYKEARQFHETRLAYFN